MPVWVTKKGLETRGWDNATDPLKHKNGGKKQQAKESRWGPAKRVNRLLWEPAAR